jgi:hypothetical protein
MPIAEITVIAWTPLHVQAENSREGENE